MNIPPVNTFLKHFRNQITQESVQNIFRFLNPFKELFFKSEIQMLLQINFLQIIINLSPSLKHWFH